MNELALFAGAGGSILAGKLLGWRTVCAVENDAYCQRVLLQRQRDGILPLFPVWDDIRTFDGREWRGRVDVVTAGFPCQPFSTAGKRRGAEDERNLWPETIRVLREIRPRFTLLENVPALLTSGYFHRVLWDLAQGGFDARWCVLSAAGCGAPHIRKRLWILAHSKDDVRRAQRGVVGACKKEVGHKEEKRPVQARMREPVHDGLAAGSSDVSHTESNGWNQGRSQSAGEQRGSDTAECGNAPDAPGERLQERNRVRPWGQEANTTIEARLWWEAEPDVGRVVDGLANRVAMLRALGNGWVPIVACKAWEAMKDAAD